ncbi:MAG: DUF1461 domain-containing protein [Clostridia bacterium]|nr:DUF1461 domain-containing protein [Clostridia bacterium]
MKKLQTLSRTFICVTLPLVMLMLIFLSVSILSGDRAWLKREYDKIDINAYTGMSTDDMIAAFMQMVDYMKGDADTMDVEVEVFGERMQMYNETERAHMVDVRSLYSRLKIAAYIVFALAVISLALALAAHRTKEERRNILRFSAKAELWSIVGVIGFLLALGAWAALDFDSFWAVFHIVFLDLESSTFDPAVSRMIQICPAELFFDMVVRIFLVAGGAMAVIAAVCGVYLKKSGKAGKPELNAK